MTQANTPEPDMSLKLNPRRLIPEPNTLRVPSLGCDRNGR